MALKGATLDLSFQISLEPVIVEFGRTAFERASRDAANACTCVDGRYELG